MEKQSEIVHNVLILSKNKSFFGTLSKMIKEIKNISPSFTWLDDKDFIIDAIFNKNWGIVIVDEAFSPTFSIQKIFNTIKKSQRLSPIIVLTEKKLDKELDKMLHLGIKDILSLEDKKLKHAIKREIEMHTLLSEKIQYESWFEEISNFDKLTKLPKKQLFLEIIQENIESNNHCGLILYLDIDKFSRINDSYGLLFGDSVLQEFSNKLQHIFNEFYISRINADKFAIWLPNIEEQKIDEMILYLKNVFDFFLHKVEVEKKELFLTYSLGVSIFPINGKTPEELLKNAETAMFAARDGGGHQLVIFEEEHTIQKTTNFLMENELRRAVKNKEFFLLYQPIIDIPNNKVIGAEALIRWKNDNLGIIPPTTFIPIAEETGLIIEIGNWVIEESMKVISNITTAHPNIFIAINLSGKQFYYDDLVSYFMNLMDKYKVSPHNIEIEITETVMLEDIDKTLGLISFFKSLGIQVALDDFGTGYSSLSYLKKLDVDILKIDKSFIKDVLVDSFNRAIIDSIKSLCASKQIKIHAEGIEEPEQLEYLQNIKCHRGQGYYFNKPLTLQDFLTFTSNFNSN